MALNAPDPDDKEETPPSTPERKHSQAARPSVVNVILLYLVLLGVGTLAGFGMFYFLYMGRCSELLQEVQSFSDKEWKQKYENVVQEKQQCQADTSVKEELYTLQGRLEAQSALAERHQSLLAQQEDALKQVSSLKDTVRDSESRWRDKQIEERALREQLADMERELIDHRTRVQNCGETLPSLASDVSRMQSYMIDRNLKFSQMEFGKGPYYVEFTLQFADNEESQSSLELELAPAVDMPHTIVSFLTLVDLQLYDGTKVTSADERMIQGGNPHDAASSQKTAKLLDRYGKFGFDATSPLAFAEHSSKHPPKEFTFCLLGSPRAGPSFAINMVDNTDLFSESNEPCFGKVVRGFDTLSKIQASPRKRNSSQPADTIEIVSVRLNRAPRKE